MLTLQALIGRDLTRWLTEPPCPTMVKLSVLIGTRNRPEALKRCLAGLAVQDYPDAEVWILDDASTAPPDEAALRGAAGAVPLYLLRSEHPLGVAGGRNRLMAEARGSLFCVLDDDAYFDDPGALSRIVKIFAKQPEIGILSFKIINHTEGRTELLTPHTRRTLRRHPGLADRPHDVSYYLGGGHALRREVVEQCGPYPEALMFGYEELGLSYRALEAGFRIRYEPGVVVHHRAEPPAFHEGTTGHPELYYLLRNRLWTAYRHLPAPYLPVYCAASAAVYGLQALKAGAWRAYARALADGFAGAGKPDRRPVGKAAVTYLKNHHGRLWY